MRRCLIAVVFAFAATFCCPIGVDGATATSCASEVSINGVLLTGGRVPHPELLPPRDGTVPAVFPTCLEGPDRRGTVSSLRGVSPQVAVAYTEGAMDIIFYARDTLPFIVDHPLKGAFGGDPGAPAPATGRRRCREHRQTISGAARFTSRNRLTLTGRGNPVTVRLDGRSRILNRPPETVIRSGQQLSLEVSRCQTRLYVDTITFDGPRPALEDPFLPDFTRETELDVPWPLVISISFTALMLLSLIAVLARWKP